jgi:riboflavin synthase
MFTGIIESAGKIYAMARLGSGGGRVEVSAPALGELAKGESIAVNGSCLTVVDWENGRFAADLSGETMARTSFREKKVGDAVNLERPLAANARLGGHFVQGHVDGTGEVTGLAREGESWWMKVRVPRELGIYVAEKGSIAIDGISLTVAKWDAREGEAAFAIIPFTYENTAIRALRPGAAVNIECDILAKYVESMMRARGGEGKKLSVEELKEQGF